MKRPSSTDNPKVGKQRHDLYESAISAYNNAIHHHYNVEAVALAESLIADRMESLANNLSSSKDYSNQTLGVLIRFLKQQNLSSFDGVLLQIDEWRRKRNDAIHQLAKCLDSDFQVHYSRIRQTAIDGLKCFREFDKQYKRYLRANN